MIKGESYDGGADVWSLGITLYELGEGEPPYFNKNAMKAHALIASRASPKFKNPSSWSSECNDFLRLCLERDVAKRPTVSKLLAHAWVTKSVVEIKKSKQGAPALKAFFDTNIKAILALRQQDDSSDESDNECDFDALAEQEEARHRAEEEEAARAQAELEAAEREAVLLRAEEEAAEEAARLKAEEAVRLKAEHAAVDLESARVKAEQEETREKAKQEATAQAAQLEVIEQTSALKSEQETAARLRAVQHAAQDGARMKEAKVREDGLTWPTCHATLAKKRNTASFKLSDWKTAFFVLDEGVLKYFRSEADYHHNLKTDLSSGDMKKERCFQLSEHSQAHMPASVKNVVEVADSVASWKISIKCDGEASCRMWVSNVEAHVKYLKFKDGRARAITTPASLGHERIDEANSLMNSSLQYDTLQHEEASTLTFEQETAAEVARLKAEQETATEATDKAARLKAEQEAADEAARLKAGQEAAEEAARLKAEQEAADEAARLKAEQEDVEEAAQLKAEQETAEEAARLKVEQEAADEAARLKAEHEVEEEAARLKVEQEGAEEAARLKAEQEAAEEAARLKAELKAELEAAEEAARLKAEQEAADGAARLEAEQEAARLKAEHEVEEEAARLRAEEEVVEEVVEVRAEQKAVATENIPADELNLDDKRPLLQDNIDSDRFTSTAKSGTSFVQANKIINDLRVTEKEQTDFKIKRMSKQLTSQLSTNKGRNQSSAMPCLMRGWVYKRTDHVHNWKRRYVVLENSVIRYYVTDKNINPRGIFILSEHSTVQKEGNIIRIDHVKGTHDDGKTIFSSRPFVFRLQTEDWALDTWALAVQDNIEHCKNAMQKLPKHLKRMSDTEAEADNESA